MKIVSVAGMRELDEAAIRAGIAADVLMDRAGRGAADEILAFCASHLHPSHVRRWVVLAGKGNNGGDAYVVARELAARSSLPVAVFATLPPAQLTGAARHHAELLPRTVPVHVVEELPAAALAPGGVIIDGLLGTGISGTLRPPCPRLIEQINASRLPVAALDLPSGLDGDSGEGTDVVVADLTLTMGLPKAGLLTPSGLAHCGRLVCVDIGLPPESVAAAPAAGDAIFAADAARLLDRVPHDVHKNHLGHTLVVGGSVDYAGAPMLTAAAALRAGCGLVTAAVPEAARHLMHPPLLALIVRGVADGGAGHFTSASERGIQSLTPRMQAAVFGPGTGAYADTFAVLQVLLRGPFPLVIDADGLRRLAEHPDRTARAAPTVLTPHPGEMRRLLEGFGLPELLAEPRPRQAVGLAARTGMHIVFKGQGTVLAAPDGRWAVNSSGSSALATGGTGDVLTGLVAGFLAQGMAPWDSMCLAAFLHGRAAELAGAGNRAFVADDLLPLIGPVFRELTPFA